MKASAGGQRDQDRRDIERREQSTGEDDEIEK